MSKILKIFVWFYFKKIGCVLTWKMSNQNFKLPHKKKKLRK